MKRLIVFIFLILLYCSKDSPLPDAPTPTPIVKYTLSVTASEGGSVNNTGGTHNANTNVTISANPEAGYEFFTNKRIHTIKE